MGSLQIPLNTLVEQVFQSGAPIAFERLKPGSDDLDAGDYNVLIKGDLVPDVVLRSGRSVVVRGAMLGRPGHPCRVEAAGDVVVFGPVLRAELRGRRIYLGGKSGHCVLDAEDRVEIRGDLEDTRIRVGEGKASERALERIRGEMQRLRGEVDVLEQQLKIDYRRVEKLLQASRMSCSFEIGQIVRSENGRLKIDLDPFYAVVKDRTEDDIDRALNEFYARAVMGILTRINRPYISSGANNRKIFMATIRDLHQLFLLVRKRDRVRGQVQVLKSEMNRALEDFSGKRPSVCVGGAVLPGVEARFDFLDRAENAAGEPSIEVRKAQLSVRVGRTVSQREIVRMDTRGEDSITVCAPKELESVYFYVEDGGVVWERVGGDV